MKKIWVYLLGVISGVFLSFVILVMIGHIGSRYAGVTFFDAPGQVMSDNSYKVFQALESGSALAEGNKSNLLVLLWDENKTAYYDGQVVKLPTGKHFRQIGVYKYQTKLGVDKTVPVVTIYAK